MLPLTSLLTAHDGKAFRMLCIIDAFSRESLAIRVARKLKATDIIEALCELFVSPGIPAHIRSDNGAEFVAEALRDWIATVGAKTAYIHPACRAARIITTALVTRSPAGTVTTTAAATGIPTLVSHGDASKRSPRYRTWKSIGEWLLRKLRRQAGR